MEITPHPRLLEALFYHKPRVSRIFKDVLGIYEIDHVAVAKISSTKILTFSSTPAMEFNLFNSNLWNFDNSYSPDWFTQCSQAHWEALYTQTRYDELYYLKQVKHHYPIGYSLAAKLEENYFIYSFASHRACVETRELFTNNIDNIYKIGQYCSKMLDQLFQDYNNLPELFSKKSKVEYETSD